MSAEPQIRVTIDDLLTGDHEVVEIADDYLLITAGACESKGFQVYANGTHVVTIKRPAGGGRVTGSKEVPSAAERADKRQDCDTACVHGVPYEGPCGECPPVEVRGARPPAAPATVWPTDA